VAPHPVAAHDAIGLDFLRLLLPDAFVFTDVCVVI